MSPVRLALGGLTAEIAARLAKQATFGPTPALIDHMVALGSEEAWIDEQFDLRASTYADLASRPVPTSFCQGTAGQEALSCNRDNFQGDSGRNALLRECYQ
ncbi:hypothetical protein [Caulobacter sp. UC70_42]|uniref:hypothetical protein n=1 Tax=Caulobacter sp. UC70_42 TaxID=3374551 RepID=UPI003756F36E